VRQWLRQSRPHRRQNARPGCSHIARPNGCGVSEHI